MFQTLYSTPLATCAKINGQCPALGAILALSCDHRVMVSVHTVRARRAEGTDACT